MIPPPIPETELATLIAVDRAGSVTIDRIRTIICALERRHFATSRLEYKPPPSAEVQVYMSPAASRASNVVCSIADWKRLYQSAILEHGSSKMAESRHAMLNRAETPVSETKEGESSDLTYALRMLRLLEKAASGERSAA